MSKVVVREIRRGAFTVYGIGGHWSGCGSICNEVLSRLVDLEGERKAWLSFSTSKPKGRNGHYGKICRTYHRKDNDPRTTGRSKFLIGVGPTGEVRGMSTYTSFDDAISRIVRELGMEGKVSKAHPLYVWVDLPA